MSLQLQQRLKAHLAQCQHGLAIAAAAASASCANSHNPSSDNEARYQHTARTQTGWFKTFFTHTFYCCMLCCETKPAASHNCNIKQGATRTTAAHAAITALLCVRVNDCLIWCCSAPVTSKMMLLL